MKNILSGIFNFIKTNKKKLLISLLIIPLAIVGFIFTKKPTVKSEEVVDETQRTIVLSKGELYSSVNIKGTIQSNEVSSVSTNLTSKVIEVNVKVGDQVKKGDIIAKLDSTDIQREIADKSKETSNEKSLLQDAYDKLIKQKNNMYESRKNTETDKNNTINKAKQVLDQKNGELNNAKNAYNSAVSEKNTVEGQIKPSIDAMSEAEKASQNAYQVWQSEITRDNAFVYVPTARIDGEDDVTYETRKKNEEIAFNSSIEKTESKDKVTKAEDNYKKAQENLKSKQEELASAQSLYDYEIINTKLNDALSKKTSLESERQEAENAYNSSISDKNTALGEIDNNISSLNDSINEAYKKIKDYNASSGLKELNEKLAGTILKAESDGKVTELKVNVGSVPSGTIATIQSTSKLMISAKVQDYDITKISVGQKVKVTTEASTDVFEGTLTRISPTASAEGDFDVDISLPESEKLFIGTKAKAEIILFSKKDVISIPIDAVLEKDDGSYIITKGTDGKLKEIKITKGDTTDLFIEISGPEVKEGLEVLANADWDSLKAQAEESINNSGGF